MTTNARPELTFDGFGINGPDEFRTRIATFTRDNGDEYGDLFAAATELLAVCQLVAALPLENFAGCRIGYAIRSARAAIAKAMKGTPCNAN